MSRHVLKKKKFFGFRFALSLSLSLSLSYSLSICVCVGLPLTVHELKLERFFEDQQQTKKNDKMQFKREIIVCLCKRYEHTVYTFLLQQLLPFWPFPLSLSPPRRLGLFDFLKIVLGCWGAWLCLFCRSLRVKATTRVMSGLLALQP